MAAREIIVKKYVVRLSGEEREQLAALTRKGRGPAQRLMKARILLKADASEAGEGWSDNQIIEALEMPLPSRNERTAGSCALIASQEALPSFLMVMSLRLEASSSISRRCHGAAVSAHGSASD